MASLCEIYFLQLPKASPVSCPLKQNWMNLFSLPLTALCVFVENFQVLSKVFSNLNKIVFILQSCEKKWFNEHKWFQNAFPPGHSQNKIFMGNVLLKMLLSGVRTHAWMPCSQCKHGDSLFLCSVHWTLTNTARRKVKWFMWLLKIMFSKDI